MKFAHFFVDRPIFAAVVSIATGGLIDGAAILAVIAINGTFGSSTPELIVRMRRVASQPSMFGIWQSMKTTSKRSSFRRSMA